jgi:transposase InsO family protein
LRDQAETGNIAYGINHKRLHRVYCAMKLNLPRRTKRPLPTRIRQPLAAPSGLNQIWALDFMADALYGGRAFRKLNLIDEGNRQVLGIEVAHSIPGLRVIRVMEQLIDLHGKPRALRLDNGPELTSVAFTENILCSLPKEAAGIPLMITTDRSEGGSRKPNSRADAVRTERTRLVLTTVAECWRTV